MLYVFDNTPGTEFDEIVKEFVVDVVSEAGYHIAAVMEFDLVRVSTRVEVVAVIHCEGPIEKLWFALLYLTPVNPFTYRTRKHSPGEPTSRNLIPGGTRIMTSFV